jgi:hypothetical protein
MDWTETKRAWWRLRRAWADLRVARLESAQAAFGRRLFIARRTLRNIDHEEPLSERKPDAQ